MITDHISKSKLYFSTHPLFEKAFNYLTKNDFSKIPSGTYTIEQDKAFAIVNRYASKTIDDSFSESHKKFIDIQFIYSGKEKIGYGFYDDFAHETYDSEKDLQKHKGELSFINIEENYFTIFFPHDVHMPGLIVDQPEEIIKVVIKVAV